MSRHEFTQQEIADRLGLSVSAVTKIEQRALAKLRAMLEQTERQNIENQYGHGKKE